MIRQLMFKIFIHLGLKFFSHIDIYAPDGKVVGITFSNSKEYIDKVGEIDNEMRISKS